MKRIFTLLVMFVCVMTTYAEDYAIKILGTQITSENCSDVLGDGTVVYNPTSNELTLNGAQLVNNTPGYVIDAEKSVLVSIKGDVLIEQKYSSYAAMILRAQTCPFVGRTADAKLTVKNYQQPAILLWGTETASYTFMDLELDVSTQMNCFWAKYGANLVLRNVKATLATQNYVPIDGCTNVSLLDCYVTNPEGAEWDATNKCYTAGGTNVKSLLEITQAEKYGIIVCNTQVTNLNCTDILGDGTVSYEPESHVLTLNGADITYREGIRLDIKKSTTIMLKGKNKIHATDGYGIITGWSGEDVYDRTTYICSEDDGSLDIISDNNAALSYTNSTICIRNCTLDLIGDTWGLKAGWSFTLFADNANIYAFGNTGAINVGGDRLTNCYLDSPKGAEVNKDDKTKAGYYLDGELCTEVEIKAGEPIIEYPIQLLDTKVTSQNCADVLGDGTVSYDPEANVLTLNGTSITRTTAGYVLDAECDLNINIKGNVLLEQKYSSYASVILNGDYQYNIQGSEGAVLTVKDYQQPAILLWGLSTTTIKDLELNVSTMMYEFRSKQGANLVLDNVKATLVSQGYEPINGLGNVELKNCYVSNPLGATYDTENKYFTLNGEAVKSLLEITQGEEPEPVIEYGIQVKDTQVTSANCTDVLGDGTVSYDPEALVLTLNGADITASEGIKLHIKKTTTIMLKGQNKIHATEGYGIWTEWTGEDVYDRATIICSETGGSLNIISDKYAGIQYRSTGVHVRNCTLDVTGNTWGLQAGWSYTLYAVNANIHAFGNTGAINVGGAKLTDCYLDSPKGAEVNKDDVDLSGYYLNGEICTEVEIKAGEPIVEYPIQVMDTKVNSQNCADILGDGTVSYDAEANVLTLDGANITRNTPGYILEAEGELTINVKGNVVLDQKYSSYANFILRGDYNYTIQGTEGAVLTVKDYQQPAILIPGNSESTTTIKDLELNVSTMMYCLHARNNANLVLDNVKATLETQTYEPINNFTSVELKNCYVSNPLGATYDTDKKCFTLDGSAVKSLLEISQGEEPYDAIDAVSATSDAPCYNVQGVQVGANYRGIIIKNGKRLLVK